MLVKNLKEYLGRPAGDLPVKILKGPNRGFWWTLYPWPSYWRGTYLEEDTLRIIDEFIRPGSTCYDLGAHFGFYTLLMARRSGKTGRIFSFEPEPKNFAKLSRHVSLNRLGGRCSLFRAGASEKDGEGLMSKGWEWATTAHFRYSDEPEFQPEDTIRVETVRIDGLMESGRLSTPDFIKIDVEGHAGAALWGGDETVANSKPCILVSTHGSHESEAIAKFARRHGYKTLWSLSRKPWHASVSRADEGVLLSA